MLRAAAFIEPCLPSPAEKPPSGSNWIHEIKHDGYRLMARRDPVGTRLLTRTTRFPLVVEAVNHLKVRSCLIDGEVVCCDERGLAIFSTLRQRRNEARAFLFAFANVERVLCRGRRVLDRTVWAGRGPHRLTYSSRSLRT